MKENGIESLFTIQAMTFDMVLDGSDLVGLARTCQVWCLSSTSFDDVLSCLFDLSVLV